MAQDASDKERPDILTLAPLVIDINFAAEGGLCVSEVLFATDKALNLRGADGSVRVLTNSMIMPGPGYASLLQDEFDKASRLAAAGMTFAFGFAGRRRLYDPEMPYDSLQKRCGNLDYGLEQAFYHFTAKSKDHCLYNAVFRGLPDNNSVRFARELSARFISGAAELKSGAADGAALERGVRKFCGAGQGLTPQGDDFLTGLAAAMMLFKKINRLEFQNCEYYMTLCRGSFKSGANALSFFFLDNILSNRYDIVQKSFIVNLFYGYRTRFTEEILKRGHTSGNDFLAGFFFGYINFYRRGK